MREVHTRGWAAARDEEKAEYTHLANRRGSDIACVLNGLLAGAFGSSRQVAAILGERDFRNIYQQGVHESIYTSLVGDLWLLVIVFDRQTHVGLVKVLARRAVEELEHSLERVRSGGTSAKEAVVNVQFRASVDSTIDRLFRD